MKLSELLKLLIDDTTVVNLFESSDDEPEEPLDVAWAYIITKQWGNRIVESFSPGADCELYVYVEKDKEE